MCAKITKFITIILIESIQLFFLMFVVQHSIIEREKGYM